MLKKEYQYDKEIFIKDELMYAMNYFKYPEVLKKEIAIDHLEDAMIRKMSIAKIDDYNQLGEYVKEIKSYPDDTNVKFQFASRKDD